ncbi:MULTISPECIES: hypothetical protein [unclassified Methylobacterium]|uniref:hypothetical protein n=1 Tax=unclassified Methylobacterium TaxID=2615210 RepID=UPI000CB4079E|nr:MULTISPECIES: hypothetical protein [unclassified Methylobacterium]PIU06620.1 MAG: hypothetical protein COT56_08805 [Methylobacterium sp. CG09_land_8_20_14_0_10_71_15]PIU12112.1 MAG: hypothetical protein COT28_16925 [Methylobacterium sp. CG08_land_8_20_14_0_20_71_15]
MAKPARTKPAAEPVTPAEGLHRKPPKTVGRTARVFSASAIATMLDVNRGTITRWINDGMPTAKEPVRDGEAYEIDIAEAVRWLQKRAMADAVADGKESTAGLAGYTPKDGGETYEEARTRKERANANSAESDAEIKAVAAAERKRSVAPVSLMLDRIQQENVKLGTALSGIGRDVEARLLKAEPERIGKAVDAAIQKALSNHRGFDYASVVTGAEVAEGDEDEGDLPPGADPEVGA